MDIWIVKAENTNDIDFSVSAHATEQLAYEDAAKAVLDYCQNNWDDDESDVRDDLIRVLSNNPTLKQCKIGIQTFNDYASNYDFGQFYYVEKLEVNGIPDASKTAGVIYIPNPNGGNGCTCKKCGNFSEYAGPNQSDGTFVCAGCRLWAGIIT